MIKCVAICGSYRGKRSDTVRYTTNFLTYLEKEFQEELVTHIISPKEYNIENCIGCISCFLTGRCPIKDDMFEVKKKLLEADIIIFSSPVFLHGIPGVMKSIFDRLSYWSHLFYLRGKLFVTMSVSDSNGNENVSYDLKKYGEYLGMLNINKIEIKSSLTSITGIKSVLEYEAKKTYQIIAKKNIEIPQQIEDSFQSFKYTYTNELGGSKKEVLYWKSELAHYNSYSQCFWDSCKLFDKIQIKESFSLESFLANHK